jgi:hypothetical protein
MMEMEQTGKFFVVENLGFSGIHIQHPNPREGRDIVLKSWEAKVIDPEGWDRSPYLDELEEQGKIKVYYADKRPAPVPNLPPEAPHDPRSLRAIYEIAIGDTVIEGESYSTMLIGLNPFLQGVYTGRGADVDTAFLKEQMYPILEWALWVLDRFPRAKYRKERIPMIKKRMEEIRKLP